MKIGAILREDGVAAAVLDGGDGPVDLVAAASALGLPPPPAPGRAFVAAWEAGGAPLRDLCARALGERPAAARVAPAAARFLPAVPDAATVLAVGLNYRTHCAEQNKTPPEEPMFFAKVTSCLLGHDAPIPAWPITAELDYEGELAVVIGRGGRAIPEAAALDHVFGYAIMNDVTARDLQRRDRQWTRAKGLDGFGPLGPFVTTRDEVPDPQDLRVRTWVNDEPRQDGHTSDMAFTVAALVSIASQAITLRPGDVITTGTPSGVGVYLQPPRFLKPGDVVRIRIDGLGELVNRVVAAG
jgi:2-keto-4-pentenoate hydratase/2-oxohepta-3-ene-1,7-dioic acid hydratase in catechol pathway